MFEVYKQRCYELMNLYNLCNLYKLSLCAITRIKPFKSVAEGVFEKITFHAPQIYHN